MEKFILSIIIFFSVQLFANEILVEQGSGEIEYNKMYSIPKIKCEEADTRAKLDALRNAVGEVISGETFTFCESNQDGSQCHLLQSIWTSIGLYSQGVIIKWDYVKDPITGENYSLEQLSNNLEKCTVTGIATIQTLPEQDPNFNLDVSINNKKHITSIVVDKDHPQYNTISKSWSPVNFSIIPKKDMYVQMFQWQPSYQEEKNIKKIFPNKKQPKNYLPSSREFVVGSVNGQNYLKAAFPNVKNITDKIEEINEWVIIIGTENSISLLNEYSFVDLNKEISRIALDNQKIFITTSGYLMIKN